jgi:tripartite-type tricarboxylate transporter receptor subunit TctC
MQTVPYKGTAPAMNDLLGGQVDIMCDQTTNTTGQIEAGKVKAYAVTSTKRLTTPALKNLPTLDEAGLKGFNVNIWHGVYAPKGTPKAVVDRSTRRCARAEGSRLHQARRGARRGHHHRRPPRRRRAQEVRRRRDRQVEPDHQGGGQYAD